MFRKLHSAWRQRSLPTSLVGLRGIRGVSYSQFGEDAVVKPIIGHRQTPGVYVDVGCFHPVRLSNTYALYLEGWSGLCVDPNATFARDWRELRPRDRHLNVAISSSEGHAFYVEDSTSPNLNRIVNRVEGPIAAGRMVETKRLEHVLAQEWGDRQTIDLMTVDCEGHDLSVVMSNDFSRYRPRVLIVEDTAPLGEGSLHEFCLASGYTLVAATHLSRVYKDTKSKV